MGPIEMIAIKFPGSQFRGEIVPALRELVEGGTIRIVDILFVAMQSDGKMKVLEVADLDDESYPIFDPIVSDVTGMLSEEDARRISSGLEIGDSAAMMLFENLWATRFADAVANAKGELMFSERIPRAVVEEAMSSQQKAA